MTARFALPTGATPLYYCRYCGELLEYRDPVYGNALTTDAVWVRSMAWTGENDRGWANAANRACRACRPCAEAQLVAADIKEALGG